MNRLILIISFFVLQLNFISAQPSDPSLITVGAAQMESYLPFITGKRVALVVNQTSVIDKTHLVDTLVAVGIEVKKVFSPEHGFRGQADAGEKVKDGIDLSTNLPLVSLYGSNKKPTKEQLTDVDVVIFDIQDVGTRFYTYISTMHYVMEAAAENGKSVIVLDRPNPNGMYVDGPVLEKEFRSFVGMHPIPIVHGLTVGELAKMINGEQWLENGVSCDLQVIPVKGYTHKMKYSLPIKPSPNLPNDLAISLYPSLCLFEGTVISVGRGTNSPFQQIGHPLFIGMDHAFTPRSTAGAKYPPYEDKDCFGIDFTNDSPEYRFTLKYLIDFYNTYNGSDPYFNNFFSKLVGNAMLQEQIKSGMSEIKIKETWKDGLTKYKALRKKHLLYPDFE